MGSGRDCFGDLCKMQVIASLLQAGRIRAALLPLLGADRAEDVGGSGTRAARRTGAAAALRPAASDFVLLADADLGRRFRRT